MHMDQARGARITRKKRGINYYVIENEIVEEKLNEFERAQTQLPNNYSRSGSNLEGSD